MAPKAKPVAEVGSVNAHKGGFRARVRLGAAAFRGPTRATEAEATADLNAARDGASSKEDIAQHLAALGRPSAATGASAAEQRPTGASGSTEPTMLETDEAVYTFVVRVRGIIMVTRFE